MLFFFRYFNLISLDATLIALVWQEVIARTENVTLRCYERAVLGISVWIIYSADHLLDSFFLKKPLTLPSKADKALTLTINKAPRHHFIAKYRSLFIFLVGIFLTLDASFSLKLTRPLLLAGISLSIAAFFYLVINAWLVAHGRWLHGREIVIALIFSLGTGLVPLMQSQQPALIIRSLFFFALLCAINTTLVARLERGVAYEFLLAPLNKNVARWLRVAIVCLFAVGFFYRITPIAEALFISLLGLLLIPDITKKWGDETASLAADGVLLLGGLFSFLV